MAEEPEKALTLEEQLDQDILGYNQRIVQLTAQLNQAIGAKLEAQGIKKWRKEHEKAKD